MSTNDVPQCDDVIVARGRQAEGSRFQTASAVIVGIKVFDNMLPNGVMVLPVLEPCEGRMR